MKKIIFFNILITLALFPYGMQRWMHLPYTEGIWTLETFMVFGNFLAGAALSISNVCLLFSLKWTKFKAFFLRLTMIFLALLFVYPIYAGIILGYEGNSIGVDLLALVLLYGNLWLSNNEYQKIIDSTH